jgi:hypothetical protein
VAKNEPDKPWENAGLSESIGSIENAEKRTDLKISEKVLNRFPL